MDPPDVGSRVGSIAEGTAPWQPILVRQAADVPLADRGRRLVRVAALRRRQLDRPGHPGPGPRVCGRGGHLAAGDRRRLRHRAAAPDHRRRRRDDDQEPAAGSPDRLDGRGPGGSGRRAARALRMGRGTAPSTARSSAPGRCTTHGGVSSPPRPGPAARPGRVDGARPCGSAPPCQAQAGPAAPAAEAEAEKIAQALRERATAAQAEAVWAAARRRPRRVTPPGAPGLSRKPGPPARPAGTTALDAAGGHDGAEPPKSTWSGRAIAALVIPALILLVVWLL